MPKTFTRLCALFAVLAVTSGCVPVAVGAVGAVAADSIAEDRGTDLF